MSPSVPSPVPFGSVNGEPVELVRLEADDLAVELLSMLGRTNRSLADAARTAMTAYPQVLVNVKVSGNAKKIADSGRLQARGTVVGGIDFGNTSSAAGGKSLDRMKSPDGGRKCPPYMET